MIIWLLQQFFNPNRNDESPNSEPKPRNKIANVCVLVNRWMISPRFKSCPRIFPNFNVLSRRTHRFKSGKQSQFVLQYSPWKCVHKVELSSQAWSGRVLHVLHSIMGLWRSTAGKQQFSRPSKLIRLISNREVGNVNCVSIFFPAV